MTYQSKTWLDGQSQPNQNNSQAQRTTLEKAADDAARNNGRRYTQLRAKGVDAGTGAAGQYWVQIDV